MNNAKGLSQSNRKFIVTTLVISLLLWGSDLIRPYIQSYGDLVWIGFIIGLPTLVYFSLGYFGKKWDMDRTANDRLNRAIAGIIAGVLFAQAGLNFTAKQHSECDQEVQTRDGTECVGDYVVVDGPDKSGGLILVALGGLATWYAVAKHPKQWEDTYRE